MTAPPARDDKLPVLDLNTSEQARYAPHLLLLKLTERLDEAMASGRDPYPAFCAWESALEAWAWEDEVFLKQADKLDEIQEQHRLQYGWVSTLEYVRAWRPLYFGVMRRAGMFDLTPLPPGLASAAQRLLREHGAPDTASPENGGRASG